jgi:hypothetical protein
MVPHDHLTTRKGGLNSNGGFGPELFTKLFMSMYGWGKKRRKMSGDWQKRPPAWYIVRDVTE